MPDQSEPTKEATISLVELYLIAGYLEEYNVDHGDDRARMLMTRLMNVWTYWIEQNKPEDFNLKIGYFDEG
ncbi:hypothetical protein EPA93_08415 [Ktedonosporobacter rubrisoli]|uniref:Uncharacterized protein n=1 Tax=Ktedonosporobacter rubrisoli TaxID=2509675 RepID=A0A4P6JLB7_KTERU|nr:hypothetical protein [Ktedonosporobacter rubrisoli]QBD76027.1 hypothetical protein EPA93_08415 [Ktedonosporobacter rubrisoli]